MSIKTIESVLKIFPQNIPDPNDILNNLPNIYKEITPILWKYLQRIRKS